MRSGTNDDRRGGDSCDDLRDDTTMKEYTFYWAKTGARTTSDR